jgi:hypothetical protein
LGRRRRCLVEQRVPKYKGHSGDERNKADQKGSPFPCHEEIERRVSEKGKGEGVGEEARVSGFWRPRTEGGRSASWQSSEPLGETPKETRETRVLVRL